MELLRKHPLCRVSELLTGQQINKCGQWREVCLFSTEEDEKSDMEGKLEFLSDDR